MRPSGTSGFAHLIARLWLLAALVSLVLPAGVRLGWWLPAHLALAGAASAAIAGAMPDFAAALSAGRLPRRAWVPLGLFTGGALLVAVGHPADLAPLVVTGGAAFALGSVVLLMVVNAAWRSGVNRRHRTVVSFYRLAAVCPAAGAFLGGLLGAGVFHGDAFLDVRRAHVALNLLGFVALTVAGTLGLLLPTVLRVRAVEWRGKWAFAAFGTGLVVEVAGLLAGSVPVAAAGGIAYAAGAAELARMAAMTLAARPTKGEVVSGLHLSGAVFWLLAGAIGQAVALALGGFDAFLPFLVLCLAGGVAVQALLGAWSYMLPMAAPGGPEEHRRRLALVGRGGGGQVITYNLGLVMVVVATAGVGPASIGAVGVVVAVASTVFAVAKLSLATHSAGGSAPSGRVVGPWAWPEG